MPNNPDSPLHPSVTPEGPGKSGAWRTKWTADVRPPYIFSVDCNPAFSLVLHPIIEMTAQIPNAYQQAGEIVMLAAKAPEMYVLLDKIRDYLDRHNFAPFVFAEDGSRRCAPVTQVIAEVLAEARGEQPDAG